jgi:DNA repair exonuclease SbcCD ATPase subunit
MLEQETLLNRIGRLFKRSPKPNGDLGGGDNGHGSGNVPIVSVETRQTLLRPWGRNQATLNHLQEGFQSLTELMGAIRQNLETQGRRQDELLQHLSALPKALEMIPESNRIHGQTLQAIHEQIVGQSQQTETLGDILEKLSQSGGDQKDLLEGLRERMETLNHQDKAMADSLNTVGAAMESASRNSATSAEVLTHLRDNLRTRDADLEQVLHRQGVRFTTMLAVAIFLSVGALVAVVVMGYLMMHGAGK